MPRRIKRFALIWWVASGQSDVIPLSSIPKKNQAVDALATLTWKDFTTKKEQKQVAKVIAIGSNESDLHKIIINQAGEIHNLEEKIFSEDVLANQKKITEAKKLTKNIQHSSRSKIELQIRQDAPISFDSVSKTSAKTRSTRTRKASTINSADVPQDPITGPTSSDLQHHDSNSAPIMQYPQARQPPPASNPFPAYGHASGLLPSLGLNPPSVYNSSQASPSSPAYSPHPVSDPSPVSNLSLAYNPRPPASNPFPAYSPYSVSDPSPVSNPSPAHYPRTPVSNPSPAYSPYSVSDPSPVSNPSPAHYPRTPVSNPSPAYSPYSVSDPSPVSNPSPAYYPRTPASNPSPAYSPYSVSDPSPVSNPSPAYYPRTPASNPSPAYSPYSVSDPSPVSNPSPAYNRPPAPHSPSPYNPPPASHSLSAYNPPPISGPQHDRISEHPWKSRSQPHQENAQQGFQSTYNADTSLDNTETIEQNSNSETVSSDESYDGGTGLFSSMKFGEVTDKDIHFQEQLLNAMKKARDNQDKKDVNSEKRFPVASHYFEEGVDKVEISPNCGFYLQKAKATYLELKTKASDNDWKILVRESLLEVYGSSIANYSATGIRGSRPGIDPQLFQGLYEWVNRTSSPAYIQKKAFVDFINKLSSNKRKYRKSSKQPPKKRVKIQSSRAGMTLENPDDKTVPRSRGSLPNVNQNNSRSGETQSATFESPALSSENDSNQDVQKQSCGNNYTLTPI